MRNLTSKLIKTYTEINTVLKMSAPEKLLTLGKVVHTIGMVEMLTRPNKATTAEVVFTSLQLAAVYSDNIVAGNVLGLCRSAAQLLDPNYRVFDKRNIVPMLVSTAAAVVVNT